MNDLLVSTEDIAKAIPCTKPYASVNALTYNNENEKEGNWFTARVTSRAENTILLPLGTMISRS